MACARLRCGSVILLALGLASWVLALGGLGATNWLVCSNYQRTLDSIATNLADNYDTNNPALLAAVSADVAAKLNLPVRGSDASSDVALCSRSWRWEWFVMFFQFAILVSGLVVSMMPARLARARYPLANMLSIAAVLVMVAVNENITDVWYFWDQHKLFSDWQGVLRQFYMSSAALVAGWILVIFFDLVWIGFALDAPTDCAGACPPGTASASATNDIEAPAPKK